MQVLFKKTNNIKHVDIETVTMHDACTHSPQPLAACVRIDVEDAGPLLDMAELTAGGWGNSTASTGVRAD